MNRNTWIIIVVAVIVIIGLIWIFNKGGPSDVTTVQQSVALPTTAG